MVGADGPAAERAGRWLREGGLVAFPTETVYGLGADAWNAAAVRGIFAAKGRPADNPLIVHIGERAWLADVAARVTPLADELAERFWPGPLTIVVDAAAELPRETTGGLDTVAVRMPDHPVALALLRHAGVPTAAPSANRSGRPSPTTARHVAADLAGVDGMVLDGGACPLGVESTVVDARGSTPVVLREGAVTREQLGTAGRGPAGREGAQDPAGRQPASAPGGPPPGDEGEQQVAAGRSPGTRYRHYTPACRVEIAPPGAGPDRGVELVRAGTRVGLVASVPAPEGAETVAVAGGADQLARVLYDALRTADDLRLDVLVVEAVPEVGMGRAVMDRLRRAAG